MDEIRSAYKAFLEGPGGKDLLAWILNKEIIAQMEGRKALTTDEKAFAMVKLSDGYDLRSYLDEMSKPSNPPAGRSVRS